MVPQPHLPSLLLAAWPADARVACASPQVQGGLTTTWSGLAARRRLPKASVPSTPTFNGENVPTGTGMMHRELRGDLGGGADLSEATCLDHGHDPSERLDAAVRLASGGTRAQRPVEGGRPSAATAFRRPAAPNQDSTLLCRAVTPHDEGWRPVAPCVFFGAPMGGVDHPNDRFCAGRRGEVPACYSRATARSAPVQKLSFLCQISQAAAYEGGCPTPTSKSRVGRSRGPIPTLLSHQGSSGGARTPISGRYRAVSAVTGRFQPPWVSGVGPPWSPCPVGGSGWVGGASEAAKTKF